MRLPVHVEPSGMAPPDVDYRWDADTDILSARVRATGDLPASIVAELAADGDAGATPVTPVPTNRPGLSPELSLTGAVELEGPDGSWIVLDLEQGHLAGVEIAVWPNVRRVTLLAPPADPEDVRVRVAARKRSTARGAEGPAAIEVTTRLTAEADPSERTIHFRLGARREARAVRLGRDLLVDIDVQGHLAGLWLLNVPSVPTLT